MAQYDVDDLLIAAGEGERKENSDMLIKVRADQVGGDWGMMEGTIEPLQLLTPHTHEHEDQVVFIIEGALEFEVGGKDGLRFSAGAGAYVIKPRGVAHGFWNADPEVTVRYIELSGRDNFEKFVDSTDEGTVQASVKAKPEHGITFHVEQIPRLMKENGLTSISAMETPSIALP